MSQCNNIKNAIDHLIDEVKKRPVLWHWNRKKNRERSSIAWAEVARALKLREDIIKPKWKNLRDIFSRVHAKVTSKRKLRPKWRYYNALLFLSSSINANATTTKAVDCIEYELERSGSNVFDSNDLIQNETFDQPIDNDPIDIEYGDVQNVNLKMENAEYGDNEYLMGFQSDSVPNKLVETKEPDDTDYDLLYFKSLVPYFKSLDPIRKLYVRNKMQDILIDELLSKERDNSSQVLSSSKHD